MSEHEVGKIEVTLESTSGGVRASAMVKNTFGYRHSVLYQGYTQKEILSRFAREVRELNKAASI